MSRSSYKSGSLLAHLWIFLTVMLTTCVFSSTPPGMPVCPRPKSPQESSPLARRRARRRRFHPAPERDSHGGNAAIEAV
ncbi:hypothetical protein EDB89DRAFT_551560 [Lactarius sanguifluus]|nr:hypothetical protein EDB89DRAFT_551560 [Lactarius sanguifluus]